jgi:hypothetical protein
MGLVGSWLTGNSIIIGGAVDLMPRAMTSANGLRLGNLIKSAYLIENPARQAALKDKQVS